MKQGILIFVSLLSVALARPGIFSSPLTLATLTPGAQVGPDGRVVDTPEVAAAKAEHAAAQVNERINLANEAVRSGSVQLQAVVNPQPSVIASSLVSGAVLVPGAPVGPDGRVLDTPEVAVAKAAHAAAQVNERIALANEAARSSAAGVVTIPDETIVPVLANGGLVTSVGPDGRVRDTPEVSAAKAAHAIAQVNERINLANEAARSSGTVVTFQGESLVPVFAANRVLTSIVPGAPIGPDGRVQDTPEVAVAKAAHVTAHINEKINLANEAAKSAGVLAVAAPSLAIGRLVY